MKRSKVNAHQSLFVSLPMLFFFICYLEASHRPPSSDFVTPKTHAHGASTEHMEGSCIPQFSSPPPFAPLQSHHHKRTFGEFKTTISAPINAVGTSEGSGIAVGVGELSIIDWKEEWETCLGSGKLAGAFVLGCWCVQYGTWDAPKHHSCTW